MSTWRSKFVGQPWEMHVVKNVVEWVTFDMHQLPKQSTTEVRSKIRLATIAVLGKV